MFLITFAAEDKTRRRKKGNLRLDVENKDVLQSREMTDFKNNISLEMQEVGNSSAKQFEQMENIY